MSTITGPNAPSDISSPLNSPPSRDGRGRRGTSWFAPFWRWHFYASFLVIPVLAMLAVTGLIYLFRFQIEPALHPDLMRVDAPAGGAALQSYNNQLFALDTALQAQGEGDAVVASVTEPLTPSDPTRFTVVLADESTRDYFVNPYTGTVLGSLNPDTTLSGTAVRLHGDLMTGGWGDYVIEVASCWAIVMALTGYYLAVKGRKARRRVLAKARAEAASGAPGAATATRHARNRQWHALSGAVVGIGLLGMLVTGLPWTGFWGEKAQTLATQNGTSFWSLDHGAASDPTSTLDESLPHSHAQDIPWALGKNEQPTSTPTSSGTVANLDTAVVVAVQEGLHRPLTITLPDGGDGVFSAISYAFHDPAQEKTVHIDQYGGQAVATYGYDQYPVLAKTVSRGIALHEGRHFGTLNMIASAGFCVLVLFMCISGPLMWWRRRPKNGTLGAPRAKMPLKATPLLAVGIAALAVFLPLFGLSLVAILILDQLVLRRAGRLSSWFNVKP